MACGVFKGWVRDNSAFLWSNVLGYTAGAGIALLVGPKKERGNSDDLLAVTALSVACSAQGMLLVMSALRQLEDMNSSDESNVNPKSLYFRKISVLTAKIGYPLNAFCVGSSVVLNLVPTTFCVLSTSAFAGINMGLSGLGAFATLGSYAFNLMGICSSIKASAVIPPGTEIELPRAEAKRRDIGFDYSKL